MRLSGKQRVLVAMGALAAVLVAGRVAFALSVPGGSGSVFDPSPATANCMQNIGGTIKNTCSFNVSWFIGLAVNQGCHTVAIDGTNVSGILECGLISQTQSGGGSGATFASFPLGTSVQLPNTCSPGSGILYLECGMGPSDVINTVNYSQ